MPAETTLPAEFYTGIVADIRRHLGSPNDSAPGGADTAHTIVLTLRPASS